MTSELFWPFELPMEGRKMSEIFISDFLISKNTSFQDLSSLVQDLSSEKEQNKLGKNKQVETKLYQKKTCLQVDVIFSCNSARPLIGLPCSLYSMLYGSRMIGL